MNYKNNYSNLIEKSREDIMKELGEGFNYYQNDIWTYNLKKDWLGRWILLYLYFQDNKVIRIRTGH